MCLIHTSSKASQRAGLEMDTLYLKELDNLRQSDIFRPDQQPFFPVKDPRLHQSKRRILQTRILWPHILREYRSITTLIFALVDEEGRYYCVEGVFPAASKTWFPWDFYWRDRRI